MKVECPHCSGIVAIDDADVKSYVSSLLGSGCSEAKRKAMKKNGSKPRPGAQGKPRWTFCKTCGKAIPVKGTKGYCDEHRPAT